MIRSVIAFGIQAAGCLYAGYWAIFFGSVAFLIITSYLREHRHHPARKTAAHELHYDQAHRSAGMGEQSLESKGFPPK
jgi:hypothetical protein